jgi:WD40 repeat protein
MPFCVPPDALANRQILTCGADTFVKVFDTDNFAAEPRTIEHHDSPVTTLAINKKVWKMPASAELFHECRPPA